MNRLGTYAFIIAMISVSQNSFSETPTQQTTAPAAHAAPAAAPSGPTAENPFPLRAKYPNLSYISLDDMAKEVGTALIVDTRSEYEFNVLHIEGAQRAGIATMNFLADLEKIRKKEDSSKKIILYCNGIMCSQSYDAGKKATADGWQNIHVFDTGIGGWAKKHPDKSVFMGQKLMDASKLFPADKLKAHEISWEAMKAKDGSADSVFIDVREPYMRTKNPQIKDLRTIPLSRIDAVMKAKQFQDKNIYFMDGSGKQLQWLQYSLEQNGYKNYFFMKEGLEQILH